MSKNVDPKQCKAAQCPWQDYVVYLGISGNDQSRSQLEVVPLARTQMTFPARGPRMDSVVKGHRTMVEITIFNGKTHYKWYRTMEDHHIFNGTTHYLDGAIFHGKLLVMTRSGTFGIGVS